MKSKSIEVILYTAEDKLGTSHLEYWIPELIYSRVAFQVICRNKIVYNKTKTKYPFIEVLFAQTAKDIELILMEKDDLAKILYMSNHPKNIHLLKFNTYSHIYIGSEYSDEKSRITKFMKAYDEIWVSGQKMLDKLIDSNIGLDQVEIKIIGVPQLRSQIKSTGDTILYMPTFESNINHQISSLYLLPSIAYHLLDNSINILLPEKLGNNDKTLLNIERDIKNQYPLISIYRGKEHKKNLIKSSGIIICDLPNIDKNCIASTSPILTYTPPELLIPQDKFQKHNQAYMFSSTDELILLIKKINSGFDELSSQRELNLEYILGASQIKNEKFKNLLQSEY